MRREQNSIIRKSKMTMERDSFLKLKDSQAESKDIMLEDKQVLGYISRYSNWIRSCNVMHIVEID